MNMTPQPGAYSCKDEAGRMKILLNHLERLAPLISVKQHRNIRESIEALVLRLRKTGDANGDAVSIEHPVEESSVTTEQKTSVLSVDDGILEYWLVWQKEFESRPLSAKIVELGVSSMYALISARLIQPSIATIPSIDDIIATLYSVYPSIIDSTHATIDRCELELVKLLMLIGTRPPLSGSNGLHGNSLLHGSSILFDIFKKSKVSANQSAARAALTQIVVETAATMGKEEADRQANEDCRRLLAMFCEKTELSSPAGLSACLFGIELVRTILEQVADLAEWQKSLNGPLHHMLLVIGKRSQSLLNAPALFNEVLSLVTFCMQRFMEPMKESIEIISRMFFLDATILSSAQQSAVLAAFAKVFEEEPQVLMDVFVNYDCDLVCAPILGKLVVLASKHRTTTNALHTAAVDFLASVISAVGDWHEDASRRQLHNVQRPSHEGVLDIREVHRRRDLVSECIRVFKEKPRRGIEKLLENGLIDEIVPSSPQSRLIKFLRLTPGLDKTALGEYLGDPDNGQALKLFCDSMDFGGAEFLPALRSFLQTFRLPGEAQKIERILQAFSDRFYSQLKTEVGRTEDRPSQPMDVYGEADTVLRLAYFTIMLNTEWHSPALRASSIGRRAQRERDVFVGGRHNIRIDGAGELPESLMNSIYDDIVREEIRMEGASISVASLPLGLRELKPWRMAARPDVAQGAIEVIADNWTAASGHYLACAYDDDSEGERKSAMLDAFEIFIRLACHFELDRTRNMLLSTMTLPYNQHIPGASHCSLLFRHRLMDLAEELASSLGSGWTIVLQCLSMVDCASLVDAHHNIREFELGRMEGDTLCHFYRGLVSIAVDGSVENTNSSTFLVKHYAERFKQLPAHALERLLSSKYLDTVSSSTRPSGIFAVLATAATIPALAGPAFDLLKRANGEQIPLILNSAAAVHEFVPCIVEFCSNGRRSMDGEHRAMEAVEMLREAGRLLFATFEANRASLSAPKTTAMAKDIFVEEEHFYLCWYPVLSALSRVAIDQLSMLSTIHSKLALSAVAALFDVLGIMAVALSPPYWRTIFRATIRPLFEEAEGHVCSTLVIKVAACAIENTVELVSNHKSGLLGTDTILEQTAEMVEMLVARLHEEPAIRALTAFHQLVLLNYGSFEEKHWLVATKTLKRVFEELSPGELMDFEGVPSPNTTKDLGQEGHGESSYNGLERPASIPGSLSRSVSRLETQSSLSIDSPSPQRDLFARLRTKCALQLRLLSMLESLLLHGSHPQAPPDAVLFSLPTAQRAVWLGCIQQSYHFARDFNLNYPLRQRLWKAGFHPTYEQLVLVKQETASLRLELGMLFGLELRDHACLQQEETPGTREEGGLEEWEKKQSISTSVHVLQKLISFLAKDPNDRKKGVHNWAATALLVLSSLTSLNSSRPRQMVLDRELATVFECAVQLATNTDGEAEAEIKHAAGDLVRAIMHRLFQLAQSNHGQERDLEENTRNIERMDLRDSLSTDEAHSLESPDQLSL